MPDLLGYDVESRLLFVAASVVVWVTVFTLISVIRGGGIFDGVIPGMFGGLSFGLFSYYLQRVVED